MLALDVFLLTILLIADPINVVEEDVELRVSIARSILHLNHVNYYTCISTQPYLHYIQIKCSRGLPGLVAL